MTGKQSFVILVVLIILLSVFALWIRGEINSLGGVDKLAKEAGASYEVSKQIEIVKLFKNMVYVQDLRTGICYAMLGKDWEVVPCDSIPSELLNEFDVSHDEAFYRDE